MKTKLKNTIRISSAILVSALVITTVSGCSLFPAKTPAKEVRKDLVIWSFDDEDLWKSTFQDLEASLEGVNVKYVKKSLNDTYENDALNSLLSDQGPDIWAMPSDWVQRHKDKLSSMAASGKKYNFDETFADIISQSGKIDGDYYAIAPAVDPLVLYTNPEIMENKLEEIRQKDQAGTIAPEEAERIKTLLSNPPNTWNDVQDIDQLITKRNGESIEIATIALGTAKNIPNANDIVYALMLQNETKMTSDKGDLATFNLPSTISTGEEVVPGKRALDFFVDFSNPASKNYSWNASMPVSYEAFLQGKVSMIIGSASLENYFIQTNPNFKLTKSPLPQIGGADDSKVIDYGKFTALTVPNTSPYQSLAWQVIMRLSIEKADDYANAKKIISSAKLPDQKPTISGRQSNGVSNNLVQTATNWLKGKYPREIDSIFNAAIDNAATNKLTTQAALDGAVAKITPLLRKTQW